MKSAHVIIMLVTLFLILLLELQCEIIIIFLDVFVANPFFDFGDGFCGIKMLGTCSGTVHYGFTSDVCAYVRMCVCVCKHIYMCMCVCMCVYVRAYVCVCACL